jgi:hypothetical protein
MEDNLQRIEAAVACLSDIKSHLEKLRQELKGGPAISDMIVTDACACGKGLSRQDHWGHEKWHQWEICMEELELRE